MIFAVHKRTKEHRVSVVGDSWAAEDWDLVQADADGWIEWNGGECPLPEGHLCDVRHRDGELCEEVPAGVAAIPTRNDAEFWSYNAAMPSGDIIAYRPILDAKPKPKERKAPMPEQGAGATTPRRPFLDSGRLIERFGPFPVGPTAWDGEGLPPVGTVCEVDIGSWVECEIIAHFKQRRSMVAAFITPYPNSDGAVRLDSLVADHFRPIRSEEDRATGEIACVIADSLGIASEDWWTAACAIYRAGYRKTGVE